MIFSVRPADEADYASLVACDAHAQGHLCRRDALRSWLQVGCCILAEAESGPVGFVILEHHFFGHGFVPLICVSEAVRRQGIALQLLAAAEARCRTSKLFSSTNASNTSAQQLLERAGFVRSGTIENLDPCDPEFVYFKRLRR